MKILIAVDGSEQALRGVRFAARLAAQIPSPELTLLYVRPSHTGAVVGLGAPDPLLERRLEDEVSTVEREVLDEAAAALAEHNLGANRRVETGTPGAAINRVAADGAFELIVLGSRGHGEFKSVLLGSTSDTVIHGAPCPVLVVR